MSFISAGLASQYPNDWAEARRTQVADATFRDWNTIQYNAIQYNTIQ